MEKGEEARPALPWSHEGWPILTLFLGCRQGMSHRKGSPLACQTGPLGAQVGATPPGNLLGRVPARHLQAYKLQPLQAHEPVGVENQEFLPLHSHLSLQITHPPSSFSPFILLCVFILFLNSTLCKHSSNHHKSSKLMKLSIAYSPSRKSSSSSSSQLEFE
jgi:hypothetical protein